MQYSKARLAKAIALNKPVKEELETTLENLINETNKAISEKRLPQTAEKIKTAKSELQDLCEWVGVTELLYNECEEKKLLQLSDEQVKRAICTARSFTTYGTKENHQTGRMEKSSKSVDYDIPALLTRLGVDVSDFNANLGALTLTIAMKAAADTDSASKQNILANFSSDPNVRAKLDAGADFSSNRTMCKAIQDCVNAFLPEADFKAINKDANFFVLAATKLDKKNRCSITSGKREEVKKIFFDYVHSLLVNNGIAAYTVNFKAGSDKERSFGKVVATPEIEDIKPEEAIAAKPEETVAAKPEKKSRAKKSAAEKKSRAKKPAKEEVAA